MEKAISVKKQWDIIVGLGNPTDRFQHTYHNIGWLCIDALTQDVAWKQPKGKPFFMAQKDGKIFIKLASFMNESGSALFSALSYNKASLANIMIIHDDSDMRVGTFKIVHGQRSAGHKGVQSIIDTFKSQDFWRCKIGIRPKEEIVRKKAEEFVLKKMSQSDKEAFEEVLKQIAKELSS